MADDVVLARFAQLENTVRKAGESLGRLREENARLHGEVTRLTDENAQLKREASKVGDERRQVLVQIDTLLKDIGKLDLE
jgi:predicted RNase H-like nuclease (RuvC/YqgF family)